MAVAEIVSEAAGDLLGSEAAIELVENPRGAETMVEEFGVDISAAREALGWEPEESVEASVRRLLERHA